MTAMTATEVPHNDSLCRCGRDPIDLPLDVPPGCTCACQACFQRRAVLMHLRRLDALDKRLLKAGILLSDLVDLVKSRMDLYAIVGELVEMKMEQSYLVPRSKK